MILIYMQYFDETSENQRSQHELEIEVTSNRLGPVYPFIT